MPRPCHNDGAATPGPSTTGTRVALSSAFASMEPDTAHVRTGSPVRVRKRALQSPCTGRSLQSGRLAQAPVRNGYGPFMELSGPEGVHRLPNWARGPIQPDPPRRTDPTPQPPAREPWRIAGPSRAVRPRCARDLPKRMPRSSLGRPAVSSAASRLSWGKLVEHGAAGGGVGRPRWVHTGPSAQTCQKITVRIRCAALSIARFVVYERYG